MQSKKLYYIDISAESIGDYISCDSYKNGSVCGDDPTVTVNKGDIINFDVDAFSHPFYKKTEFSRGGGNQVTPGTLFVTPGTQYGKNIM